MKNTSLAFFLLLVCSLPSFAGIYTFYDLEAAKIFNSTEKNRYYLQISLKNGMHQKIIEQKIQSTISFPVAFHQANNQLMVIIGPMHTAEEVRKTSTQIIALQTAHLKSTQKKTHVTAHKKPETIAKPFLTSVEFQKEPIEKAHRWYLGAGVGAQQLNTENPIYVLQNSMPNPNRYWTHTTAETLVSAEVGHQWNLEKRWLSILELGFYYNHLFPTNVGDMISVNDPNTRDYVYNWNVSSDVFLALGRAILFKYEKFLPFVEVGIGGTLNHSTQYSETPLPGIEQRPNPFFKNNTNSALAYAVGGGIGWKFDPHFTLSIAYQFQGLGHIDSGNTQNQLWHGGTLKNDTYQTNLAVLRLDYYL